MTDGPLIVRGIWSRMRAETPETLTSVQFGLLSMLCQERLTLTELAQRWGVSAPTMSKTVSLLVTRGLVAREECPDDRRSKWLRATEAGREAYERVGRALLHDLARSLDALDDAQRAEIVSALGTLARILL